MRENVWRELPADEEEADGLRGETPTAGRSTWDSAIISLHNYFSVGAKCVTYARPRADTDSE